MKVLSRPFVITLSTLSLCACGKDKSPVTTPTIEPPMNPPDPRPNPTPTPTTDDLKMSDYPRLKNAKDASGRAIFAGWQPGEKCFVELEWPKDKPRMPGQAPPTQDVACPPEMQKKEWEACRGGSIHAKEKAEECICFHMGNPPPPPKRTACP